LPVVHREKEQIRIGKTKGTEFANRTMSRRREEKTCGDESATELGEGANNVTNPKKETVFATESVNSGVRRVEL